MAIIRRSDQGQVSRFGGLDPFRMMQELMRWEPLGELAGTEPAAFLVPFEVKETGDAYVFKADLPGIKEEDLDISLTGSRLTISGKRESEERRDDERYFAYERTYGTFSRSFTLPEGIDTEHVQAELKHGVLTLALPKKPEVQPKRISVRPASGKKEEKARA
jgi:HSP20 family protein